MLKDRNVAYMSDNHPEFYSGSYSTQNLKLKMRRHFTTGLEFWLPSSGNKSELVYSSHIDVGEATETAFNAAASELPFLKKRLLYCIGVCKMHGCLQQMTHGQHQLNTYRVE